MFGYIKSDYANLYVKDTASGIISAFESNLEGAINICSNKVMIPMVAGVESLNVAISGGIIMYQIAKNKLI